MERPQKSWDEWDTKPISLPTRNPKSQRFHDLLKEMGELHDRKQADYGNPDDPFANVRASDDFGIPAWIGAVIRMNDKMRRLQTASRRTLEKVYTDDGRTVVRMANESVTDSFLDLAVYALIGLLLFEEDEL